MNFCKSIGCHDTVDHGSDFCTGCNWSNSSIQAKELEDRQTNVQKYPMYFKDVTALDEIDVYMVHHLFNVQDPSGAIQHASKKLLLSGVRTGGKSQLKDIKEARDSLSRWLQIQDLFQQHEPATPTPS